MKSDTEILSEHFRKKYAVEFAALEARGKAEGLTEGFFAGMLASLKTWMQKQQATAEAAFEMFSIPQDERPKYRAALAMA